jgi:ribosome-associated translation inhibitor RaiA
VFAPVQISLYGIAPSKALESAVREKARQLERVYDRITGCRVVLIFDGSHQRQGKNFSVEIAVKVAGGEIAVTREHDEDLRAALRESFGAARSALEDYALEKKARLSPRQGAA